MSAAAWNTELSHSEWLRIRQGCDELIGSGRVDELFRFVPFMY
jgi:hypothetical protein